MTDSLQDRRIAARTRLDTLSGRAGLAIAWERLWPCFAAILVVLPATGIGALGAEPAPSPMPAKSRASCALVKVAWMVR